MDDSTLAPSIGAGLCGRVLLQRHAFRLPSDVHVVWVHGVAWAGHPLGIQSKGKHVDILQDACCSFIVVKFSLTVRYLPVFLQQHSLCLPPDIYVPSPLVLRLTRALLWRERIAMSWR